MSDRIIEDDSLTTQQDLTKRKPAKVVYPLEYTRQLQDFDNWDHFVSLRLYGRLTVHDFPAPPERVLDLGCGTGLWVIDAARQWKDSAFVGFDLKNIQPDLFRCGMVDLAARIQWVHGNFLEELPFPAEYFDFVRIRLIGLGVSEDKWPHLLADVARILKPGGLLELMEEDLIFPSGHLPRIPSSSTSLSLPSQKSANSSRITLINNKSDYSLDISSPTASVGDNLLIEKADSQDSESLNLCPGSRHSADYAVNPRDHRRLLASWKEMLHNRFLAPQLVSILPFYLSSMFDTVQPQPLIQVRLPPNSGIVHRDPEDHSSYDHDSGISYNIQYPFISKDAPKPHPSAPLPSSTRPLQLARKVYTIMACKEPIWAEYEALYGSSPTVSQVLGRNTNTARDEFEFHWSNWANDMTDRIGMRNVLSSSLSWPRPPADDPPSQPWRNKCGIIYSEEVDDMLDPSDADICRSLRCFLAWKIKHD